MYSLYAYNIVFKKDLKVTLLLNRSEKKSLYTLHTTFTFQKTHNKKADHGSKFFRKVLYSKRQDFL